MDKSPPSPNYIARLTALEITMGELMTILAFGTLGFVVVASFIASRATANLKDDPDHTRSSLCVTSDEWKKIS